MADFETDESMFSGESPDTGEGNTPEPAHQPKPDPEVARLQRELDSARARISEADQAAQYWAEQAKGSKKAAPEPKEDEEPEADEDPDKFTEALAADGVKALYKRGIPTKKEIVALIEERSTKIASELLAKRENVLTREGELLREFPDLRDDKSEFFQETAKILREEFGDNPEFQRSPAALKVAAKLAKASMGKRVETDDDLALRISSQGDRGTRRSPDTGDDGLGSQERQIIARMGQYGVTEKGFKEHRAAIRGGRG